MKGILENRAVELPTYKTDVEKNDKTRSYKLLSFLLWSPLLACTLMWTRKAFSPGLENKV